MHIRNLNFGVQFLLWTFMACPNPGGGRPVDDFFSQLGPQAKNGLAAILDLLQVVERKYWLRPQFDILHGDLYRGMGEIRFRGENKIYRVFGFFGPRRSNFTLLLGTEKKGNLKREMKLAATRKRFAEEHEALLYEFVF